MKFIVLSVLFFPVACALCACSAILDSRPAYLDASEEDAGHEVDAVDNVIGEDGGQDGAEELPTSLLEDVTAISAGGRHTCALLAGGYVMCWGANESGQLGDGTQVDSNVAVPVNLPQDAISISCGASHTCAVLNDGTVWCWGGNLDGQVFPGTEHPDTVANPHHLNWWEFATSVCAGRSHSCVTVLGSEPLRSSVECWGANGKGQLGRGDEADHANISNVIFLDGTLLDDISGVACGADHTCGWTEGDVAYCWGDNSSWQLGSGLGDDHSPRAVSPVDDGGYELAGLQGMTAGTSHTCAWLTSGEGYCWGSDDHGQLCNGTANSYPYPDLITGFAQPVSVMSAGRYHGCAIPTGNVGIGCWGDNESDQVDAGATMEVKYEDPFEVSTGSWTTVSAGGSHTCAVDEDGRVHCWGDNSHGQLGNGTFDNPVTGMSAVIRL